ncbi:hypothetical protein KSP39_PZI012315 [Platanthera zijinensis]|uniref:Uncharacterized protein n=1 Tax=Platanthera zijinensis TaxID=2320716 RepID=A0AAP0G4P0_9ASPA
MPSSIQLRPQINLRECAHRRRNIVTTRLNRDIFISINIDARVLTPSKSTSAAAASLAKRFASRTLQWSPPPAPFGTVAAAMNKGIKLSFANAHLRNFICFYVQTDEIF